MAFAAYGTATLPPEGNGFIAVFVAAIALGIWRPDVRECFEAQSEDLVEIVKLGVFLVFGAIITLDGLFGDGWAAVGDRGLHAAGGAAGGGVRRARRHAARSDTAGKAFMAWFGPKGVATMDVRAVRARLGRPGGGADRQHRRAGGARLDSCARPHRPRRVRVDRAPEPDEN